MSPGRRRRLVLILWLVVTPVAGAVGYGLGGVGVAVVQIVAFGVLVPLVLWLMPPLAAPPRPEWIPQPAVGGAGLALLGAGGFALWTGTARGQRFQLHLHERTIRAADEERRWYEEHVDPERQRATIAAAAESRDPSAGIVSAAAQLC